MKLIMKTEFDNLSLNDNHEYENDVCGSKRVIKIYCNDLLIAKKIMIKKSIRYFGSTHYKDYLMSNEEYKELLEEKFLSKY